ncbi:MAG: hypothetical protein ACRC8Y_04400 [Chroococcales cyanobacterium]
MWDRNGDRPGFRRWGPNIYLEDGDRATPFAQRLKLYRKQKAVPDTHESPIKSAKPKATSTSPTEILEALEVKAIAHEAVNLCEWHRILEYDKWLHIMNSNVATTP